MSLPASPELLKHFSSFLIEAGLSAVSVKNYLSDVRHFLNFINSISSDSTPISLDSVFQSLSKYVDLYTAYQKSSFTPINSTNRRLASIRRFSTFLVTKYGSCVNQIDQNVSTNPTAKLLGLTSANTSPAINSPVAIITKLLAQFKSYLESEKKSHSTVKNYLSDVNHFLHWSANDKIFTLDTLSQTVSENELSAYNIFQQLSKTSNSLINRRQSSVKKFASFCLSEKYISKNPFIKTFSLPTLSPLSWLERFTKPATLNLPTPLHKIYKKYNELPFTPYLHLAILVLATSAMAIFAYGQIIQAANPTQATTALNRPSRQLSFQGRLTDSSSTPITTPTDVIFRLFNNLTGPTQLYTSNTCSVDPDANGIFNTLIGDVTCGAEIPASVFSDNQDVYIEVQVGGETLTPRQQIATVGYALNSETLQGYPASPSATENTIPVMNNDGDILLGSYSPDIVASSGTFNVEGQTLTLTTTVGSGGNVIIQPDTAGDGNVQVLTSAASGNQFRVQNANLTSSSLISGYIGNNTDSGGLISLSSGSTEAVKFSVRADGQTRIITDSTLADSALIINQAGGGDIFTASQSGSNKFVIKNSGNVGIGTTSPTNKLEIADGNDGTGGIITAKDGGAILMTSNGGYFLQGGNNTAGADSVRFRITENGKIEAGSSSYGYGLSSPQYSIMDDTDTGLYASAANTLGLSVGGSSAIHINSSGNVGIGDTTPDAPLDVVGDVYISDGLSLFESAVSDGTVEATKFCTGDGETNCVTDFSSIISGAGYWSRASGTLYPSNITDSLNLGATATTSALVHLAGTAGENSFINTGNVGIGTTAPGKDLEISRNGDATIRLEDTAGAGGAWDMRLDNWDGLQNYKFKIAYNDSEKLTIDTTGNVGIGLTNPGTTLDVTGTGRFSSTLTASNGFTQTTGALSLTSTSGAISSTGLTGLTQTLSSGTAAITAPTLNLNTASTGLTSIGNGTGTFSLASNTLDISTGGALTNAASYNGLVITANTGVITTGTWSASLIGLTYGGTNKNMTAVSGGIVWTDSDSMEVSAAGTSGQVLTSNGAGAPTWSATSAVNFWQRNSGVLSPLEITNSLNLGATATASALVHLAGTAGENSFVNTGNMGVGTTAPVSKITIKGTAATDAFLHVTTSTTGAAITDGLLVGLSSDTDGYILNRESGALRLGSGNAEVMRITAGDVGIGTTTPTALLDIAGTASSSSTLTFRGTTDPKINILNGEAFGIKTSPGGDGGLTEKFTILANGDTIVNTSTGTSAFYVSRIGASDQSLKVWTDDLNVTLLSEQDENAGTGGGFVFQLDNDGTQTPSFLVELKSGTDLLLLNSSGQLTTSTNETINGIDINAGAISDVTSIGMSGAITGATGYNGLVITANTGVITTGTWNASLIGLTYGGTNKNMTAVSGGIVWTDSDSMEVSAAGTSGQVLVSGGTGAPTWSSTSSVNFWQRNSGVLSPLEITNSLNLGATATASALVHLAGTAGENSFINTGNVGIGTTAPTSKLQISDATHFLRMFETDGTTNKRMYGWAAVTDNISFTARDDAGNLTRNLVTFTHDGVTSFTAGNVGIGTTSPGAKFQVNGDATAFDSSWVSASWQQAGLLSDNANYSLVSTDGGGWGSALSLIQMDISGATDFENQWSVIRQTNDDGSGDGTLNFTYGTSTDPASNSRLMVIKTDGNVGIGTTTPTALLDIAGTASSSSTLTFRGTTDPKINILNGENFGIKTSPGGDAGLTEKFTILANGNVGIGSVSPGAKLEIGTTTTTENTIVRALAGDSYNAGFEAYGSNQGTGYLFVGQNLNYGGGIFYNGDGNPAFANGEVNDTIAFYRNNAGTKEAVFSYPYNSNQVSFLGNLTVSGTGTNAFAGDSNFDSNTFFVDDSANFVGIGTASPLYSLHVSGTGRFTDNLTLTNSLILEGGASGATRVYRNLANYEGNADNVGGAIVITTNVTPGNQMSVVSLKGYKYSSTGAGGTGHNIDIDINSYFNTAFSNRGYNNKGDVDFSDVRIGTNSANLVTIVLGDVGETWSYPKLWVEKWISSHSSGADSQGNSWTVSLETDLTGYTLNTVTDQSHLLSDDQYVNVTGDSMSGNLTMTGTAANIILGSNWLSGDGGDEGIFVDSAGKIGIGTSTPGTLLELSSGAANSILTINNNDGYNPFLYLEQGGTLKGALGYRDTGDFLTLYETGADRLVIRSGNVGIGTTTPTALLDIAGTASSSSTLTFRGTTDPKINILNGEAFGIKTSPGGDGGLTEKFTILANGNVGIGTTVPVSVLHLSKDSTYSSESTSALKITDTTLTDTGGVIGADATNDAFYIQSLDPGTDYTSKKLLLNPSGGNVGIGTTSPGSTLHLSSASAGSALFLDGTATGSPYIDFRQNNVEKAWIQYNDNGASTDYLIFNAPNFNFASGNVGIGNTAPGEKLEVSGNIIPTTTNSSTLGTASKYWGGIILGDSGISDKTNTQVIDTTYRFLAKGDWVVDRGKLTISKTVPDTANDIVLDPTGTTSTITVGGGTGKIDVGTVDPPYTINGEKYSTYFSSMIGVKEEVTGNLTTSEFVAGVGYRHTLDILHQPQGSDLWVFSKTANLKNNLNKLNVLLTAQSQAKVWYEVDIEKNIVSFYSSSPTTISYRLTSPRFDYEKWTTSTPNRKSVGFILNDPDTTPNIIDLPAFSAQIAKQSDKLYLLNTNGKENKEVGGFFTAMIANLEAGIVTVSEIFTDNITVRGKLISPIADIDYLNSIDATISGTLYATNIKSDTVDSLNDQLSILSGQYSTASAILADLQAKYGSYDSLMSDINTSANILNIADLGTPTASIPADLVLNSVITQSLFAQDVQIQGSLIANSLNSSNTDLFIQPDGHQSVNLLAGLMILHPNGKIVINGDLLLSGTLFANALDAKDATISGKLALGTPTISGSDDQLLTVYNPDGNLVGSVNDSGSADFAQVATGELIIASGENTANATISGSISSNATIGTATLPTGQTEIFISSTKMDNNTLVYLTPVSDTNNQVLFVKSKQEGIGFTVAVSSPSNTQDIQFNYWLVKTK